MWSRGSGSIFSCRTSRAWLQYIHSSVLRWLQWRQNLNNLSPCCYVWRPSVCLCFIKCRAAPATCVRRPHWQPSMSPVPPRFRRGWIGCVYTPLLAMVLRDGPALALLKQAVRPASCHSGTLTLLCSQGLTSPRISRRDLLFITPRNTYSFFWHFKIL